MKKQKVKVSGLDSDWKAAVVGLSVGFWPSGFGSGFYFVCVWRGVESFAFFFFFDSDFPLIFHGFFLEYILSLH